jgi:pyruvate formate lyase activating enzyme
MDSLNIAGWSKFSTVDWPDKIVSTLFLQGCPLRCGYCHNFEILDPRIQGEIEFQNVIKHLEKRKGLLDGVVFSGGEPLMQSAIVQAIKQVKELGYEIGIHTSGYYPKTLEQILPDLSWIGFDIKAPVDKYDEVTATRNSFKNVDQSLKLLADYNNVGPSAGTGVDIQFRTTFDTTILNDEDLDKIRSLLNRYGFDEKLVVQEIRLTGVSDKYKKKFSKFLPQIPKV